MKLSLCWCSDVQRMYFADGTPLVSPVNVVLDHGARVLRSSSFTIQFELPTLLIWFRAGCNCPKQSMGPVSLD